MSVPVYAWLSAASGVTAIVGADNPAIHDAGWAPDGPEAPTRYVVWRIVSGLPENYLSEAPDMDDVRIQLDCYGRNRPEATELFDAVLEALQEHGHQVSENPEGRDENTKLYVRSADFEFWASR